MSKERRIKEMTLYAQRSQFSFSHSCLRQRCNARMLYFMCHHVREEKIMYSKIAKSLKNKHLKIT